MDILGDQCGQRRGALPCSSGVVLESHEMLDEAGRHGVNRGPRRSGFSDCDVAHQARYGVILGLRVGDLMGDERE